MDLRRPAWLWAPAVAAAGFVGSMWLPWLRAGVGADAPAFRGWDLPTIRWFFAILGLSMLVATALRSSPSLEPAARPLALFAGVVGTVTTGALLLFLEAAATLIPSSVLPVTVRRLSVEVGGGPGVWLAMVSSAIVVAHSIRPWSPPALREWFRTVWWCRDWAGRAVLAAGFGTLIAVGYARYLPWADGQVAGQHVWIEGWALPWVGPLTLVALWTLTVSFAVVAARGSTAALLFMAGAGWFVSFVSALALIATASLARARLDERLPHRVGRFVPDAGTGPGAIVGFVAGLVVAAVAAYFIAGPRSISSRTIEEGGL